MSDLDAAIIAALVSGLDEHEVASKLAVPLAKVRATVDQDMSKTFSPEGVARTRANILAELDALAVAAKARGDKEGKGLER